MPTAAEMTTRRWLIRVEGTAAVVTAVSALVLAVVALSVNGLPASGSVALGAADVLIFFTLGVLVDARALRRVDQLAGAVVLAGYALRVALLGMVAWWLVATTWVASVGWFGAGMAVATLAWVVGLIAGHVTGRWPIYDVEPVRTGVLA